MKLVLILGALVTVCVTLSGCATTPVQQGAWTGGALGAGLGAIIGNQSGDAGEGALIGAGVGALTGALIADDNQYREPRYRAPSHRVYRAPAPRPPRGHYETRVMRGPFGEHYEERVWVRY
jgi:Glycine zipper